MDSTDYLLKAVENLEMALLAQQRKKHNVCASCAYYSVFLASIAALIELTDLRARDNEWDHAQVQAELNRRLIMRRKVLPAELGRTPMDLMELRHLATTNLNQFPGPKLSEPAIEPRNFSHRLRRR